MSSDFDTLLDECLARLQNGESVDRILQDHPDHAARLRPLIEVATRVYTLPAPHARSAAFLNARQQMLTAVDEQANRPRPTIWQRLFAFPFPVCGLAQETPRVPLSAPGSKDNDTRKRP